MQDTNLQVDSIMEAASQALGCMDYLGCEDRCQEALTLAREQKDWGYYARVLLPLQEARRQRRMIAAEGTIRLGSGELSGDVSEWLKRLQVGCIVLTHRHGVEDAKNLVREARNQRLCVEVLLADNQVTDQLWVLRGFGGSVDVGCTLASPSAGLVDRWIDPEQAPAPPETSPPAPEAPPPETALASGWFLGACEALGDAAIGQVQASVGDPKRIEELEQCLAVVTDHELLHQELAVAVRAAIGTGL